MKKKFDEIIKGSDKRINSADFSIDSRPSQNHSYRASSLSSSLAFRPNLTFSNMPSRVGSTRNFVFGDGKSVPLEGEKSPSHFPFISPDIS